MKFQPCVSVHCFSFSTTWSFKRLSILPDWRASKCSGSFGKCFHKYRTNTYKRRHFRRPALEGSSQTASHSHTSRPELDPSLLSAVLFPRTRWKWSLCRSWRPKGGGREENSINKPTLVKPTCEKVPMDTVRSLQDNKHTYLFWCRRCLHWTVLAGLRFLNYLEYCQQI